MAPVPLRLNTDSAKNSDIVINHSEYGMTQDEAIAFVTQRMAEQDRKFRESQTVVLDKAPPGGWTEADKVAK